MIGRHLHVFMYIIIIAGCILAEYMYIQASASAFGVLASSIFVSKILIYLENYHCTSFYEYNLTLVHIHAFDSAFCNGTHWVPAPVMSKLIYLSISPKYVLP